MNIQIPSPILARLQVMFNSGMTLQEVTEALELELTDDAHEPASAEGDIAGSRAEAPEGKPEGKPEDGPEIEPEEAPVLVQQSPPVVVTPEKAATLPPEVGDYLYGLVKGVQKLGEQVYGLAGHVKVRKSNSLSKTSHNLIASTQSIAKLVNAINRYVPAQVIEGSGPTIDLDQWKRSSSPAKTSTASTGETGKKTTKKSTSSKSEMPILPESKLPEPKAPLAADEIKDDGKLKLPQPKSRGGAISPTDKPAQTKVDPMVRTAPPSNGSDVHSRIAAALDQITRISSEQDDDEGDAAKRPESK